MKYGSWWLLVPALLCGCEQPDLADQPRLETYETGAAFNDGLAARPVPEGTVARDQRPAATENPLPINHETLAHGRERFNVFCAPCHGRNGRGQGVIVQRGFPAPPSLHLPRLRQAGDRHFYQVIRDGYGAMYAYASRVPEDQRWAIIAYIRSLQLSRNARLDDVPRDRRPLPDTGEASP
ncbi:MAG: cytochrome c [Alloalcanivorax venustensis]|uniref:c-type cytochrome n=1 Tax=Alloalcanivorax venustensis TaxID=172371 RepID=UPI0030017CDE